MKPASSVIVRGLPPVWGTPSPSPFVIKLLTWLRMAGVEHELRPLRSPPRSATGKIPYIELPSGEIISDTARIIAHVSKERGIDLDAELGDHARATARLVRNTFETSLYFAAFYERMITPEGWARVRRDYFATLSAVPRALAPLMVRRAARRNLHGQGTGRLPREDVAAMAHADLDALAITLGDKPYFVDVVPRTIDATALGFLWACSSHPFASACRDAVESHPNLVAYVARMRARYWSDPIDTA